MSPRVTVPAVVSMVAVGLAPAARADGTAGERVATVTKDDEVSGRAMSAADFELPCIFPPDLSRLGRESERRIDRLLRRCRITGQPEVRITMLVDRAGRVREPAATGAIDEPTAACLAAGVRAWRYSRKAAAAAVELWEPARIQLDVLWPSFDSRSPRGERSLRMSGTAEPDWAP